MQCGARRSAHQRGHQRRLPPPLRALLLLALAAGAHAARSLPAAPAPAPSPLNAPSGGGYGDGQCAAASGMLEVSQPFVYDGTAALLHDCAASPGDCLALTANATIIVTAALSSTMTLDAAEAVLDGKPSALPRVPAACLQGSRLTAGPPALRSSNQRPEPDRPAQPPPPCSRLCQRFGRSSSRPI